MAPIFDEPRCLRALHLERTNFSRELLEVALAHVLGDKTEAAYQRGDMLDKRRRLMEAWAEFSRSAGQRPQ